MEQTDPVRNSPVLAGTVCSLRILESRDVSSVWTSSLRAQQCWSDCLPGNSLEQNQPFGRHCRATDIIMKNSRDLIRLTGLNQFAAIFGPGHDDFYVQIHAESDHQSPDSRRLSATVGIRRLVICLLGRNSHDNR